MAEVEEDDAMRYVPFRLIPSCRRLSKNFGKKTGNTNLFSVMKTILPPWLRERR
jgi:hypothetical protein